MAVSSARSSSVFFEKKHPTKVYLSHEGISPCISLMKVFLHRLHFSLYLGTASSKDARPLPRPFCGTTAPLGAFSDPPFLKVSSSGGSFADVSARRTSAYAFMGEIEHPAAETPNKNSLRHCLAQQIGPGNLLILEQAHPENYLYERFSHGFLLTSDHSLARYCPGRRPQCCTATPLRNFSIMFCL